MSSYPWKAWAAKKPDDDYDIVDYDDELEDEDTDQQRVEEGQLLQRQSQARGKNVYVQAMSNLMKSANKIGSASTQAVPDQSQKPKKLISHEQITTITPELAQLLAAEGTDYIRRFLSLSNPAHTNGGHSEQSLAILLSSRNAHPRT